MKRNSRIIRGSIFLGAILLVAGIFILAGLSNAKPTTVLPAQWSQQTGAGLSVPACASAVINQTCVDGQVQVTFNIGGDDNPDGIEALYINYPAPIYSINTGAPAVHTIPLGILASDTDYTYRLQDTYLDADNVPFTTLPCAPPNQPPSASDLLVPPPDYCFSSTEFFSWTYSDPDGNNQSKFQFQVDNNDNFSSPEIDRTVTVDNPSPSSNNQAVEVRQSPEPNQIAYNTPYYWQVRVWDSAGAESAWVKGTQFTTLLHAYPRPNFTHSPQKPEIGEEVLFTDTSKCYSAPDNTEYECKTEADEKIQYQWDFDYDGPFTVDSTQKGNTTTTYSQPKNYTVGLRIRDHSLSPPAVCIGTGDSPVVAILPLPIWREIPPF